MEPTYYTVTTINGDYAYMVSDTGVENQVAMFLLPEGTDMGDIRTRSYYYYDKANEALVRPFLDFVASPAGQKKTLELGFIPR